MFLEITNPGSARGRPAGLVLLPYHQPGPDQYLMGYLGSVTSLSAQAIDLLLVFVQQPVEASSDRSPCSYLGHRVVG